MHLRDRKTALGAAQGPESSWFHVTDGTVYFDHPVHAMADHTLNIDFADPAKGPSARVAVELTARRPATGRRDRGGAAVGTGRSHRLTALSRWGRSARPRATLGPDRSEHERSGGTGGRGAAEPPARFRDSTRQLSGCAPPARCAPSRPARSCSARVTRPTTSSSSSPGGRDRAGYGEENRVIAVHGAHRFLGELSLLTGSAVYLTAVVRDPGEVIQVPRPRCASWSPRTRSSRT